MKKFDKELVFYIYSKLSILIGLAIFLVLFMYFRMFPEGMYGVVDKGIFKLDFAVSFGVNETIFNFPLILFIVFFLFNLGLLIYSQVGNKLAVGTLTGSIFYNTILSFLLIVAHLVFYYVIPDTINGAIVIGLIDYEFEVLSDVSKTGYNFAYLLATVYTFYNVFVVYSLTKNKG